MKIKGGLGPLFLILLGIILFIIYYIISHNAFHEDFTDMTSSLRRKIRDFENQTRCCVGYERPENLDGFHFAA